MILCPGSHEIDPTRRAQQAEIATARGSQPVVGGVSDGFAVGAGLWASRKSQPNNRKAKGL